MTENEEPPRRAGRRSAPEVVAPTTRVNVSMPFSRIELREPSEELSELVSIVVELIGVLESVKHEPEMKRLHQRATVLQARVH